MIIDGHAHACGIYLTADSILENLKIQGIDKIILSAGEHESSKNYSLPALGKIFRSSRLIYWNNKLTREIIKRTTAVSDLEIENERIAVLAEEYPEHIMNTYWVNMNEAKCIENIEEFMKRHDFAMLKMHQCWTPFKMRDINCLKVIKLAGKINKPIFIHLLSKQQVREFISVAEEYPNIIFIVAHLIGIEEFRGDLRNKNIYFDLSCPQLNSIKMLKRAYSLAGAQRLLLGSDTPYGKNNIKVVISKLKKISLTEDEINLICSGNLQRILKQ